MTTDAESSSDQTNPLSKLSLLHYYLDYTHATFEGMSRKLSDPYRPGGSERKVALMWAMWMADSKSPNPDAPAKSSVAMLRRAIDQVRNHDAVVFLDQCKVVCGTGDVIDFTGGAEGA